MKKNKLIFISALCCFLLTRTSAFVKGETLVGLSDERMKIEETEKAFDTGNSIENFTVLCQYPELPTGCEITSLAMLLNYYGFSVDKCILSDVYLNKGEVGTVDFHKAFEGDPRSEDSFGCYAPVIVDTANRFLEDNNSELHAVDLTGTEFVDLLHYIDKKIPVITWGTLDCEEGYYSVTWNVDGVDFTWFTPEHCRVLLTYNDKYVWAADPAYGEIVQYDREIFEDRYNSLQKQAVILE